MTTTTACPNWCTTDAQPQDDSYGPVHWTTVEVDGLALEFSQGEDTEGPTFVPPDADNGLSLPEARRYALALLEACSRIEGHNVTGLVARRVAGRLVAQPIESDQIEALADALGVEGPELDMNNPEAVRS
jgi:hypothetical protein